MHPRIHPPSGVASSHPLAVFVMQVSEHVCRLDPVDDALNIVTVPSQGRQLDVIKRSVMLPRVRRGQMKGRTAEQWKR